jgi:uncharacterized phiE125 gp8 family phage protein
MLTRLTVPLTEPLTLLDLKTYLRLDCADDDAWLETLLTTARTWLEEQGHFAFSPCDYRLTFCVAPLKLTLPIAPLQAVSAVNSQDETGVYMPLDSNAYTLCENQLTFVTPQKEVEILFTAGFLTPPAPLLLALRMLAAHWYDNRALMGDTRLKNLPYALQSLLSTQKKVRLI